MQLNATACERVTQFSLNYTPEIFNDLCALSQNSKTIYCMKKLKLSLNFKSNAVSTIISLNNIKQIIRDIKANKCNRL